MICFKKWQSSRSQDGQVGSPRKSRGASRGPKKSSRTIGVSQSVKEDIQGLPGGQGGRQGCPIGSMGMSWAAQGVKKEVRGVPEGQLARLRGPLVSSGRQGCPGGPRGLRGTSGGSQGSKVSLRIIGDNC